MTDCESIQDRVPLVANGEAEWSEAEAAHLASCRECAAEWRLIQTARRLGDTAATRIDPAQVGRAVLARLAAERRRSRWKRSGWLAVLAAAAAVTLVVRLSSHGPGAGSESMPPSATAFHVPIAELERLDAGQLESVLEGLDEPLGSQAAPDAPHLGDLDDHQLERVLRSLEG
jgi:anti-sigma factor RsiW